MSDWRRIADSLPGISLAAVNDSLSLQTRVDRKYVVTHDEWARTLRSLAPTLRVLDIDGRREFRYSSVYFDTPELDSYLAAVYRRRRRYKVRIRHYEDTGERAIEVKLRSGSGQLVKHRQWLDHDDASDNGHLPEKARDFAAAFDEVRPNVARLQETLTTSYTRMTMVTDGARTTVDDGVSAIAADGTTIDFGPVLVVETKSSRRVSHVDHALWAAGIRPTKVSKYCTSLAQVYPELPANRWARTLRSGIPYVSATADTSTKG